MRKQGITRSSIHLIRRRFGVPHYQSTTTGGSDPHVIHGVFRSLTSSDTRFGHRDVLPNSSTSPALQFSTIASDDVNDEDLTTNHYQKEKAIISEIRALAQSRQGKKAEETFYKFLNQQQQQYGKRNNASSLTDDELLTCCNLVLWGWASTDDVDASRRAGQVLKSMQVTPNAMSYKFYLKCLSRVKHSKSHHAGREAERIINIMKNSGVRDLGSAYHMAIKTCTKTGDGERALFLLQEMSHEQRKQQQQQKKKQQMNSSTGGHHNSHQQQQLPLMVNKHVVNTVLLALKNRPEEAEELLDNMYGLTGIRPDEIHYSTVLSAWASAKDGPRAEALLNKMHANGIKDNVAARRDLMRAWTGNLERQEELFRAMVEDYLNCPYRKGEELTHSNSSGTTATKNSNSSIIGAAVKPDAQSLSVLLSAQAQANSPERAEDLLVWVMTNPDIQTFLRPNIVCFSCIIHAWARAKQPERAEALTRQILQHGYEANVIIYTTVMHGWATIGNVERVTALWEEMTKKSNIVPTHQAMNTLALAYANANRPGEAQSVLERVEKEFNITPDLMSYSTLLRAWTRSDQLHKARELLDKLRFREEADDVKLLDVVSYNTVLKGYSDRGMADDANEFLSQMLLNKRILPDQSTFSLTLSAYTKSKDARHRQMAGERAESLIKVMQDIGVKPDTTNFNVFLNCFAKSGYLERAESLLMKMMQVSSIQVDTVSLNTCLNGWAAAGNAERAEQLLSEIARNESCHQFGNNIDPDTQSFSIVLKAWARGGRNNGSTEDAEHAEALLRYMSTLTDRCKPDTVSYNTVLGAWLRIASCFRRPNVALLCAKRADLLFSEMEAARDDKNRSGQVRSIAPDRITYQTLIQLWTFAGNEARVKRLQKQAHAMQRKGCWGRQR